MALAPPVVAMARRHRFKCRGPWAWALPQVVAHYVAMTPNGRVFESSVDKGKPYDIRVGGGQVRAPSMHPFLANPNPNPNPCCQIAHQTTASLPLGPHHRARKSSR